MSKSLVSRFLTHGVHAKITGELLCSNYVVYGNRLDIQPKYFEASKSTHREMVTVPIKWVNPIPNNVTKRAQVCTARCYASAVLAMGLCLSVSVCLSVTSQSSTKTAKRRITQTTPHDSPVTLVF